MIDIRMLVCKIKTTVEAHNMGEAGEYSRWLWQDNTGSRELGINEYGCADAANILYTIGEFPQKPEDRKKWIDTLQLLQHPQTGMFIEKTHHRIHTTAHCIAALELFDAQPLHPLAELQSLTSRGALDAFLDSLDWSGNPWNESHKGAGFYAAMVLAGQVSPEWEDWYFQWLWDESDPKTGFWRKDNVDPDKHLHFFCCLAGSFHYLFNHEFTRRPLRYPEAMVDSCLEIYRKNLFTPLGKSISFSEIDWVYCLNRSCRQSGYKFEECRTALRDFAVTYIQYLNQIDSEKDDGFNDLHSLFGMTCALAELQQALPGFIRSDKPLKLVLDRRPFI